MYQFSQSPDVSSYFSSTKLRPLSQPTSHTHTDTHRHTHARAHKRTHRQTHTDTHTDTDTLLLCGFKEQPLNVNEENTLLTKLRLPHNHNKASHPPHQPWKNLNFGKRKHKRQDREKRDREEALSRDVIHIATFIFLFFPATYNCARGGRLCLANIHVKVFPVRSVRRPNSTMGDWLSPQVGPFFPHSVLLLLLFPPFTVVSLVLMSLSCL